jgi:hypothetical protein
VNPIPTSAETFDVESDGSLDRDRSSDRDEIVVIEEHAYETGPGFRRVPGGHLVFEEIATCGELRMRGSAREHLLE